VDLYERESLRYVIPVFVWGFAVATAVSLFFNTVASFTISSIAGQQAADFLTPVFVAPVVEEGAKGLALLLIFLVASFAARKRGLLEFYGVMDGIVYGSAVGFGFAIAEDILYGMQYGAETFVVRRIFGGFAHAAFTSLTGIGIGLIPWVHSRALKVVFPLLGLAGAMLLHAIFNFTATVFGPVAYLVMFLVILLYVLIIIVWLAVERRVIRAELQDEVAAGTITLQEYVILPSYFRRTGYYLRLVLTGRLSTWFRRENSTGPPWTWLSPSVSPGASASRPGSSGYCFCGRRYRVFGVRRPRGRPPERTARGLGGDPRRRREPQNGNRQALPRSRKDTAPPPRPRRPRGAVQGGPGGRWGGCLAARRKADRR
jgi:RsiW-degrading membrane proteinase PrsW (M82 family)